VTRGAPDRITVAEDGLVVAGPPGYCVDRRLTRPDTSPAFVMMASCAAISGNPDQPAPAAPALLTVTVSPEIGRDVPLSALEAFVDSPGGRDALSRTGDGRSLEILDTRTDGDALFVHVRDAGGGTRTLSDRYWRVLFPVNDRLVIGSVVALQAAPVSDAEGYATLVRLTDRLRRENPDPVFATRGRL